MAADAKPQFTLALTAPGSGLKNSERGWSLFDSMAESYGRGDYTWHTWGDVLFSCPANFADYSSVVFVPEINALICRPYPRQYEADAIPLDDWGVVGSGGTTWEEQTATGAFGMYNSWYVQLDAALTSENGLYYGYAAPPQPCFEVIIGRYEPDSTWNMAGWDAWSRIVWGGGRFELLVPWNRPATLYDASRNFLMEIPLNFQDVLGMQFFSLRVMHLRGRVLFSSDRGGSYHVYGTGDKPENSIVTAAGSIQVTNLGAAWSFNLVPIDFPVIGRFRSKAFDKGYAPTNSVTGGGAGGEASDYMYNAWGGYAAPSVAITEVALGTSRYCQYQATLTPTSYAAGSTWFGHTPELYAVRLQNLPVAASVASVSPDTIAAGDVLSIEITEDEQMEMPTCRLRLNNQEGQNYQNLREYGLVNLDLKAHDSSTYYNAFDGYIYQVEPEDSTEGDFVTLSCVGLWLPFEDVKCTAADPVFSGRSIGDAAEWAALRCGIAFTKTDFEMTTTLPLGLDGQRTIQPEPGRSWGDFLSWLATYEQKYLYFDGTTLTYAGEPDENTITWHFKCSTDEAGAPAGALPIIGFINAPRDPGDHRNEVRVLGRDVDGRIMEAVKRDAANQAVVGHEKMVYLQDPALDTQERVNLVCATLYNKLSRYPPRRASFRIRGKPDVKRRDVIKIWGGSAKVDRQVFRISALRHRWERESAPQFFTEIEAVFLRDDA